MSDDDVRTLLWEWHTELEDPDPEQQGWKGEFVDGMLLAAERLGIAWSGPSPPPRRADADAARRHLEALLGDVRPMMREPDEDRRRASLRFDAAVDALAAAGAIDDPVAWRTRALRAEAPWLDDDAVAELSEAEGVYAIAVPPSSPEEEAEDAEHEQFHAALSDRSSALRRVATCAAPARHDGLAVVAVLARAGATDVMFHHVGAPGTEEPGLAAMQAQAAAVAALTLPTLTDEAGTRYAPAFPSPVSTHGHGGRGGPPVTTGTWRYTPAAPEAATRFTASLGAARWLLS